MLNYWKYIGLSIKYWLNGDEWHVSKSDAQFDAYGIESNIASTVLEMYSFNWDSSGSIPFNPLSNDELVCGVFLATRNEINALIDSELWFNYNNRDARDIVWFVCDEFNIHKIQTTPKIVSALYTLFGKTISGYNPMHH